MKKQRSALANPMQAKRFFILNSSFLILKEFPVDVEVLHRDIAHVLDAVPVVPVLLYIIKVTILQRYVGYMLVIVQPDSHDAVTTLFAGHVLQVDIAYRRGKTPVALLTVFITQVDTKHSLVALSYFDIPHKYILYQPTSTSAGFNTNHPVQLRTVHHAIFHIQVAVSARYLASDNHTSVPVLHLAIPHDDVARLRSVPI